jgi:hypothetical protein
MAKRLWLIFGIVIAIPVVLYGALWGYAYLAYIPSKIIDFHPSSFSVHGDQRFFYSIDDDLKYGNFINQAAPALQHGRISLFLVSPDRTKIATVANGNLTIVTEDGSLYWQVTPVDSIYREHKPIGTQFFRDQEFQWAKDSSGLYLVRDEYYNSKGSQLFSEKGELWKYDLASRKLSLVIQHFPACDYFLGPESDVYLSVATENGDMKLQHFKEGQLADVPRHEVHQQVVAQGLRGGEVGFAAAHGADLLHELHQAEVLASMKVLIMMLERLQRLTSSRVSAMTSGSRPKAFL